MELKDLFTFNFEQIFHLKELNHGFTKDPKNACFKK